jgi:hypothetical protein
MKLKFFRLQILMKFPIWSEQTFGSTLMTTMTMVTTHAQSEKRTQIENLDLLQIHFRQAK